MALWDHYDPRATYCNECFETPVDAEGGRCVPCKTSTAAEPAVCMLCDVSPVYDHYSNDPDERTCCAWCLDEMVYESGTTDPRSWPGYNGGTCAGCLHEDAEWDSLLCSSCGGEQASRASRWRDHTGSAYTSGDAEQVAESHAKKFNYSYWGESDYGYEPESTVVPPAAEEIETYKRVVTAA